jgi:hypothetical protein
MRISDLLSATVVDAAGTSLGPVRDVRVTVPRGTAEAFPVAGIVVGGGPLAHAWGFAEGRAHGPWLLRTLTARSTARARFVPADVVLDWGPGTVRLRAHAADLHSLTEELRT